MLRAIRLALAIVPFVVWFMITTYSGAYGIYSAACLISAIAGGAFLYYYVIPHGMAIHAIPVGRACVAFALCVLLPLFFCWGADKAGSTAATGEQQRKQISKRPMEEIPEGAEILTTEGKVGKVALKSFDEGEDYAMDKIGNKVDAIARVVGVDPSTDRVTTVIQDSRRKLPLVVKTSEHTWEVKFHAPGTRVVETRFPLPLGKVYYVSTNGLVENLRVGRVAEVRTGNGLTVKQFSFSTAPASEFCRDRPHMIRQVVDVPGAHLAFLAEQVPPGDYIIKVMEPLITPAEGEHSPGVPIDREY